MTRNLTLRQIVVGLIFITAVSLVLSTPAASQAQSGTATPQQNTSSVNATVVFKNQTTNGSVVTVKRAMLPEGGFIAIHTSAFTKGLASADTTVIAVSQYLPAGRYQNITIDISHAPPGNPPGLNRTRLNSSQRLTVALYSDTNGNRRFDYVRSFGETDSLITRNDSVVRDSAYVRVPMPKPQTASVMFQNQTLKNNTLVVSKARLPRGGFLVAVNGSYRRSGDPLTSAVGLSRYLPSGTHRNVTIRVLPGALDETQVVTVLPSLDTNDNRRYDYIRTGGFQDVAYESLNHSKVVTDPALVRVPQQATVTTTPPRETRTPQPTTSTPAQTTATVSPARSNVDESDGLIGGFGIVEIITILAVFVGTVIVIRVVR